ncbi:aldo/keto reductase [Chloroflexia bacterium SDU3-3]|nr:aldo/keto reductase [Chloroflexia bacterium SDU3-3]
MRKIALGTTGVEASELSLGCMYFGTRTPERTSFDLLDQFVGAGGDLLDTANNYAFWAEGGQGGESELLLGRWMRQRGARQRVVLATKVGALPTVPGGGLESRQGLAAKTIIAEVEQSLSRLQTDYIDLYYAHIDDRDTPLEETLEAFDRLVRAGKVRAVGCSNLRAWRLAEARALCQRHGWAAYCCVQQRHTYLRPSPSADFGLQVSADADLLDYCRAHPDMRIMAYSPLLGGAYTRADRPLPPEYATADSQARLRALAQVAQELGASPGQVVLAWLLRSSPAATPVIAASDAQQLRENLAAASLALSAEQIARLSGAGA